MNSSGKTATPKVAEDTRRPGIRPLRGADRHDGLRSENGLYVSESPLWLLFILAGVRTYENDPLYAEKPQGVHGHGSRC